MEHTLDLDVEKIAQDVEIIRHRLNRIEQQIQTALLKKKSVEINESIKNEAPD